MCQIEEVIMQRLENIKRNFRLSGKGHDRDRALRIFECSLLLFVYIFSTRKFLLFVFKNLQEFILIQEAFLSH